MEAQDLSAASLLLFQPTEQLSNTSERHEGRSLEFSLKEARLTNDVYSLLSFVLKRADEDTDLLVVPCIYHRKLRTVVIYVYIEGQTGG